MATTSSSAPASTSNCQSRQARMTIKDAFSRLQQSISDDDVVEFQRTTLKDVRQAAIEIEEKLAASQSLRNMRRVETFLNGIEQYSKVLEVLCNGTPYLPWIWLSSEYLSSFEKLIDAYSRIAETFPRFDRLSAAFKNDTGFQELVAIFYADILDFHRRAYKFFRARAWKRMFDSSWERFDARFKRILNNLNQHAELIDKEANAIDIAEAKALREKLDEDLSRREKELTLHQRASVITWLDLSAIPRQDDKLDGLLFRCHPGSCDWLLQNDKVERWISDDQSHRFLWIHGKPGAGKSVLCSSLIQHLHKQSVPVLYFFCTYGSDSSSKCISLFRNFTAQTMEICADLAPYVVDNYVGKTLASSMKDLRILLPHLLSTMPPSRIILDGLDEFGVEEQRFMLEGVFSLTRSAGSGWKTLISSQDLPNISRAFSKLSQKARISLSDENQSISAAIQAFIDRKFIELNGDTLCLSPNNDLMQALKREMNEKANGMFLWVHLVLASLDEIHSLKQLEDAIHMLPSDLTGLYDRILRDLQRRLSTHAYRRVISILRLILYSYRPLKRTELLDAEVLRDCDVDDSTKLSVEALSICKPLIETEPSGSVVLVHFSLRQYLLERPDLGAREAHHDAALACTRAILAGLHLVDPSYTQVEKLVNTGKGFFSLLPYAHTFWIEHLLAFATLNGGLSAEISWELVQQLLSLHAKHDFLSANIRFDAQTQLQEYPGVAHEAFDARLRFLDFGLPFYPFIDKIARFRRTSFGQDSDLGDASLNRNVQEDPTLMTYMIHEFETIIRTLLSARSIPGLSQDLLDIFKRSHGSSAFLCRYQNCAAVSGTFSTESSRDEHEKSVHIRRIPCPNALCPCSDIGFTSQTDLKSHMQKYHSGSRRLMVTPKFRRTDRSVNSSLPRLQQPRRLPEHEQEYDPQIHQQEGRQSEIQSPIKQSQKPLTPEGLRVVEEMADAFKSRVTSEEEARIRIEISDWPLDKRAMPMKSGIDPFDVYCSQTTTDQFVRDRDVRLRASQIPADVPEPIKQKMMELPEEQFSHTIRRWNAQKHQQQEQNQQNGMFNLAQINARLQQELLRRQQQQQNSPALNPQILQRMDQTPFPPMATQSFRNQGINIPEYIKSWGELKAWASNPDVIDIVSLDKLNEFQKIHYERLTQQNQQQANNTGIHGLSGGLPNRAGGAPPFGRPNGQAPQAPAPAQIIQQQMSLSEQRQRMLSLAQQVPAQDIQRLRQQQGPIVANVSDEQLRQSIAMIRLQQQRQLQQQGKA